MKIPKRKSAHNKGKESLKKLKKIEKFRLKTPILCKKHGEHLRWRLHSYNNVQCIPCATENARKNRIKNPLKFILRDAKKHAEKSNRDFDITLEDLEKIILKQKNACALTGMIFTKEFLPSLDRIDSSKGYIRENIQLVLIKINIMKSNFNQKDFIELCKKVVSYEIQKEKIEWKEPECYGRVVLLTDNVILKTEYEDALQRSAEERCGNDGMVSGCIVAVQSIPEEQNDIEAKAGSHCVDDDKRRRRKRKETASKKIQSENARRGI